jgi:hypothetical protein
MPTAFHLYLHPSGGERAVFQSEDLAGATRFEPVTPRLQAEPVGSALSFTIDRLAYLAA